MNRKQMMVRRMRPLLMVAGLFGIAAAGGCVVRVAPPPPPHPHHYDQVWVPGHWRHGYYGDEWIPGHWE